jgi:carboxymethylenebutenolidase
VSAALSRYLSQQAKLRDRDGREFAGCFNDSALHAERAVVVVHDFLGLTPQIRSVVSRLADQRYVVFAPDLYRGRVASTRAEAVDLASHLAWNQVAVELGLAVSALAQRSARMRIASMGFGMGGAAALVAAAAVPRLNAAVSFYGIPQDVVVENPGLRVQGHFAIRDTKCTGKRVAALQQSLCARGVASEIHSYDADNGFFSPLRPEAYSPADAELAWVRTLHFLGSALA